MKKSAFLWLLPALLFVAGCGKSKSDCGTHQKVYLPSPINLFLEKDNIYWGVTGGVRKYTYNWTFSNICVNQNPKVDLAMTIYPSNTDLPNVISVNGGIYTCLAVQPQHVTFTPNETQNSYSSNEAEIGMSQCFSGQPYATIYPYITVSFNTLGSDEADSVYLEEHLRYIGGTVDYYKPQ